MTHISSRITPESISIHWDDETRSAEAIIRELAAEHDIKATVTAEDKLCDDMARLAGDDVVHDEVEQLLVNVGKLGLYDGIDLTKLHARYRRELRPR